MNAPATIAEVTPGTALAPIERAKLALKSADNTTRLAALATQSAAIVGITNKAAYQECHAARMALKNERVALEKSGQAAREDATAFSKAVIAEEARLVGLIEPEEKRLQAIQDAHDTKAETERKAKADAEAARVSAIRQRIEWIRARPVESVGKSVAELSEIIGTLTGLPITDDLYAEFADEARQVVADAGAKLTAMRVEKVANEEEAGRLKAERERLDAEKNERDQRIAAEDKERADRNAAEDAERARLRKIDDDARAAAKAKEDADAKAAKDAQDAKDKAARDAQIAASNAAAAADIKRREDAEEQRRKDRKALEDAADPWAALGLAVAALRACNRSDLKSVNDALAAADSAVKARDRLATMGEAA